MKRAINERENVSENVSWSSHQNLRHIQAARQVVEDMAVIKEVRILLSIHSNSESFSYFFIPVKNQNVIQEFKKTEILEAVIALGSSIFSAKKMLKIHLPSINQNHHCVIHENSNNSIVRHLMMSLASSPELTDFNGNASKVFLLLKKSVQPEDVISQVDFFQRMPGFQVPSKCKTTCLEILLNESETNQNGGCCKLMKICADVSNLSITELNELNDSQKIIEYDWYIASISIKGLKQSDIIF